MEEAPHCYLRLYSAVSDALILMDEMNFGAAGDVLIEGVLWARKLCEEERKGELTLETELKAWLRTGGEMLRLEDIPDLTLEEAETREIAEIRARVKALMEDAKKKI